MKLGEPNSLNWANDKIRQMIMQLIIDIICIIGNNLAQLA
jgi:hypothetical protein